MHGQRWAPRTRARRREVGLPQLLPPFQRLCRLNNLQRGILFQGQVGRMRNREELCRGAQAAAAAQERRRRRQGWRACSASSDAPFPSSAIAAALQRRLSAGDAVQHSWRPPLGLRASRNVGTDPLANWQHQIATWRCPHEAKRPCAGSLLCCASLAGRPTRAGFWAFARDRVLLSSTTALPPSLRSQPGNLFARAQFPAPTALPDVD